MSATTTAPVITVSGYFRPPARPARRNGPPAVMSLMVPCTRCDGWHTHGAGPVDAVMYSPGDQTSRVSHCHVRSLGGNDVRITVSATPWSPTWVTPRGRQSAAYRAAVKAGAA